MKVAMIHGRNHKGSTYQIAQILANKLEADATYWKEKGWTGSARPWKEDKL